jgi:type IV pilus assembly protein PilC
MIFSPRISLGSLANLCQRLGTALEAGIDVRTVWAREAERATGAARRRCRTIADAVARGESLADATAQTGDFFPPIFRELTHVGEQTGHQAEVFRQLADHYHRQINLRRAFLAAIAWPVIQLALAILIIGGLIWVMGIIREVTGNKELDPLGFGLVGSRGLALYIGFLASVGFVLFVLVRAVRRGLFWAKPVQRLVMAVPKLGDALRTMALSRLAWTMYLTMNAGMEVRRALRISLRSTQNALFLDQLDRIDGSIAEGNSIHESFQQCGVFPAEFLDALAVGEESGKLVESMALLARQYRERAQAAMATLTTLAGVGVWIAIAAGIVGPIFPRPMFYIGTINDLLKSM